MEQNKTSKLGGWKFYVDFLIIKKQIMSRKFTHSGSKGSYLFTEEEMYPRKKVSQSEFEESISGVAMQIVNACYDGFQECLELSKAHSGAARMRNFKPTILNSFMDEKLMESFKDSSGIDSDGRFYLSIGEGKLFLKKVDSGFKHKNIPTKNVGMYNNQLSASDQDSSPITIIGYQVDESYTNITGVYAIHYENGDISWVSDVEYIASNSNEAISLNYLKDNDVDEVSVAVKGGKQRKAE